MVKKNIATERKAFFVLLVLFSVILFLIVTRFVSAAPISDTRTINYLPRGQEIATVFKDYVGYKVDETVCVGIEAANTILNQCWSCEDLKLTCPDCCLANLGTAARTQQCSAFALLPKVFIPVPASADPRQQCDVVYNFVMPDYTTPEPDSDANYTDFKNYCSNAVLPGREILGCPVDEPDYNGSTEKCTAVGANWVCNRNNLDTALKNSGCVPEVASGVIDCTTLALAAHGGSFYNVVGMLPAACTAGYPGYGTCYTYTMFGDITTCLNNCLVGADQFEQAFKSADCCNRDSAVCENTPGGILGANGPRPGFNNNCSAEACLKRMNWAECLVSPVDPNCCDILTTGDCSARAKNLKVLVDDVAKGISFPCFNDITDAANQFSYDFVAKSNEKALIIWQIRATPRYCVGVCGAAGPWGAGTPPDTYFYTMVKIYDVTDGEASKVEVYPGADGDTIMNQRSFVSAFSIYAAAVAVKADGTTSLFTQGRKYSIRLHYLIAPLSDYTLEADINRLQLTILKIRD